MKLLIASDLHGCAEATEKLLSYFVDEKYDYLILLGDLLNHGPRNQLPVGYDPQHTASMLNQHASRIIAIRGNCDSEVDQALLAFPLTADYNHLLIAQRRWFLTHGHGYSPENLPPLHRDDLFCCGHFHRPQLEQGSDCWLLNPGSVAIPRGEHAASFADYVDGDLRLRYLKDGIVFMQQRV